MIGISGKEVADLYATGEFDADYYLEAYPDVHQTGLDPAVHYLWIGRRLGRRGSPRPAGGRGAGDLLDVLFVDGPGRSNSTAYRIDRVAQSLRERGARVRCITADQLEGEGGDRFRARYVTFFRAPLREPYRSFASRMRSAGCKIVFDIDDLVFEEELIPMIDGYRLLTDEQKIDYVKGVQAYRDFILVSDFCTAPTDFLAERIRSLGTRAYRVRNTLDDGAIAKFASVARAAPRPDFVIGYYSGSKTHQADFRNAGSALAEFMHENPPVVFRLVGNFDLEEYPEFQRFSESDSRKSRVTTVEPMPHSKMLEDQLECDVIIAPLEVGNPFCEAKSELKFFEASLVRRPVIASPTETLRKATRDGTFALLADQPSEWLAAFRRCIEDAEQLAAVADRAHDYVVNEYSPSAAGADAIEAYGDLFPQLSDSPFAQRSD